MSERSSPTRGEQTYLVGEDGAQRIDLSGHTGAGDAGVKVVEEGEDELMSEEGSTKAPK